MASSAFSVKIDVARLEEVAAGLGQLTPEALAAHLVDAINATAESAYALARKRILSGINLTDSYIQRKMRVDPATAQKPVATIVASGAAADMTALSHYGSMQEVKAVTWSNERIQSMGKKFGKWPGWTRRVGAEGRGIEVDEKGAGVSVEVVAGRRINIKGAFTIPGKRDNDGNLILFRRNAAGKIQALTGPSVYQLFRVAAPLITDEVYDQLETNVTTLAERQFEEALE